MEDVPLWCVSNFEFDDEDASFAIRSNGKLFYVDVSTDDLGDWSGKQEFIRLLQDAPDDYEAEESLYDLISGPCIPLLRKFAAVTQDAKSTILQEYYEPETLIFKLIGDGNDIKAVRCPEDHTKIAKLSPKIALSEIPDGLKVLHLDASTVNIIPCDDLGADAVLDTPSTVSVDNTSTLFHFKAVQDHDSFLREFGILLQLREKSLNKKYRLPTIHSLVHYSNKPSCIMGMLLNHINNTDTLADWIETRDPPHSLKEKWDHQISDTVHALHRHGIVWGDVKPDNVLIDHEKNSWLIDFGGGFNSGYVDKDIIETVEGDLQGISRISKAFLQ